MLKTFAKLVGLQPAIKIQPNYSVQCGAICGGVPIYGYVYDEYHCISSTSCSYAGCTCS